jgi:acyl-CoA dehydrogenase
MRLVRTTEQRELADSVRRFLAGTSPMSRVREIAESPEPSFDRSVWSRLSGELGLTALALPESQGGSGAGWGEVAVVMEELGAALTPAPYLSALLAAELLRGLGDAGKELLPGVAAGTTIAALALPGGTVVADEVEGGYVLNGSCAQVVHGMDAEVLLYCSPDAVFAVAPDAPGLARTPLTTFDITRPQARVDLDRTPARLLGEADVDRVLDLARVALAAEQLGGLRRCLDAIVAYAKVRVQFGRYVGSFQAVKHKLADMHCTLEQAESIVRYAAWAADEAPDELPVAAALAQSYLGPAFYQVARDHLVLHGGIGFTWEHDAHLYYRRAKADHLLLGPPRTHRRLLADRLGL